MTEPTCRSCALFDDDPASIEAEIPGFTMLGSAYSSARGQAGFCRQSDRFLDPMPARSCPWFLARATRPETTKKGEELHERREEA